MGWMKNFPNNNKLGAGKKGLMFLDTLNTQGLKIINGGSGISTSWVDFLKK